MSRRSGQKSRKTSEGERDRRNISRMYLRGMSQIEIAEELGLSQPTVSRDLKILQSEWREKRIYDIDEKKNIELAKIDNLELEYWQAWRRSLEDAETKMIEKQGVIKDGDKENKIIGSRVKQTDKKEGQSGNPAFLRGVEWCINKRCEILGLNAGNKNLNIDLSNLSTEQLERLAKGEDLYAVLANPGAG